MMRTFLVGNWVWILLALRFQAALLRDAEAA